MRGRSSIWYRIRVNLQHVPDAERPPQEPLEVDYDPWANAPGPSRHGRGPRKADAGRIRTPGGPEDRPATRCHRGRVRVARTGASAAEGGSHRIASAGRVTPGAPGDAPSHGTAVRAGEVAATAGQRTLLRDGA
jgi:hypothetical protein